MFVWFSQQKHIKIDVCYSTLIHFKSIKYAFTRKVQIKRFFFSLALSSIYRSPREVIKFILHDSSNVQLNKNNKYYCRFFLEILSFPQNILVCSYTGNNLNFSISLKSLFLSIEEIKILT